MTETGMIHRSPQVEAVYLNADYLRQRLYCTLSYCYFAKVEDASEAALNVIIKSTRGEESSRLLTRNDFDTDTA